MRYVLVWPALSKTHALICLQSAELASTYAALILADDNVDITAEKITALTTAAGVEVEPIWATLLAKALQVR